MAAAFGLLDTALTINGTAAIRDGASTLKFTRPIDPLTPNGQYTAGYKPGTGNVGLEITATLNRGRPDLIALADAATIIPVIYTLQMGSFGVTVTAQCQISARETPLAAGLGADQPDLHGRERHPRRRAVHRHPDRHHSRSGLISLPPAPSAALPAEHSGRG